MGQGEVIDCLKRAEEPLSRTEIADELGENPIKISNILAKLIKYHEVLIKEIDRVVAREKYGVKRRMNLYYISEKFIKELI